MKLAAVSFLAFAACSGEPATTVVMTVRDAPPAYGEAPMPTDALREGAHLATLRGLDRVVNRHHELIAAHLAALDGFGLRPLVEFFVTGPIDPVTLEGAAAVVDIDPDSPERGREIQMTWRFDAERGVVAGRPINGEQLREGTRYAAYLTDALRDGSGARLAPAIDALDAPPPRWRSTRDALVTLDRDDLLALTVFTTQHATGPLLAARDVLATLPPSPLAFPDPDLVFSGTAALDVVLGVATRAADGPRSGLERWGNDNRTGIAHEHVGVLATGEMTSARFRRADTGTDDADDESFADPPVVTATETIPVTFVLPATPMPAAGYPVVVFGHGLGASRDQLLALAEPITSRGYALVGIDMAGHGSRFLASDVAANMANQLPEFSGDPGRRDGFGDTTGLVTQFDFFEGFLAVSAVRDSIRQSALDLSRLVQLLRRSDLDLSALAGSGSASPRLDTTRIAYLGESFGTVVGTLLAAIEPDIQLFVLDVPGGGVLDILLPRSPEIGGTALPLIESIYGTTFQLDEWSPLIGFMQAVFDGGDPLSFAPHILADRFTVAGRPLPPRSVVAIEVMGDQVLSNEGTEALARGLGLAVLSPHMSLPAGMADVASPAAGNLDGQTAVLVQYAPATHGANWTSERGVVRYLPGFPYPGDDRFPRLPAPISITNPIYETHEQVAEILSTYFAGEAPRVRMTLAPVADFDADGTPDASDPAPFDPSR